MATTKPAAKKTPAKKATQPAERIVVDLSEPAELVISNDMFDNWDDAQEEAALAAAAAAADVKHVIIEGRLFAGRFPDGTIVQAPLTFSVADIEAITATADNPVDQMKALFSRIGQDASVETLEGQNLASVVIYAEKFFNIFSKIAEVALGKSLAS